MITRPARRDDAVVMAEIAGSLIVDYGAHKISADQETGRFLVNPHDVSGYAARLDPLGVIHDLSLVAENGSDTRGFLVACDNCALAELAERGTYGDHSPVVEFLLNQRGHFVFGEQMGVKRDLAGLGVEARIVGKLVNQIQRAGVRSLYVDILHQPVMDAASLKLWEEFGKEFKLVERVQTKEHGIAHEWGVYLLTV